MILKENLLKSAQNIYTCIHIHAFFSRETGYYLKLCPACTWVCKCTRTEYFKTYTCTGVCVSNVLPCQEVGVWKTPLDSAIPSPASVYTRKLTLVTLMYTVCYLKIE